MPRSCVAVNCTEMYKKSSGVSFHKFPADSERHKRWIIFVDRKESSPCANDRLCGKHFLEGKCGFHFNLRPEACLCAGKALPDQDHRDFVPMVFAHKASAKRSSEARYARATVRRGSATERQCCRRYRKRVMKYVTRYLQIKGTRY